MFCHRVVITSAAALLAAAAAAAQPPGGGAGTYIGGYSGGNNRGGSPGVYIGGGNPGGNGRADGSGFYIGGYPSSFSGYNYPSNPPGYKGYTTRLYPNYPDLYHPEPPRDNTVILDVHLPPSAELWFDDTRTNLKGPYREFETPPLAPGKTYAYTLKARWVERGRPVEARRDVTIRPGQRVEVNFLAAPR